VLLAVKFEGTDIMQISGHKNVASINNYSTLSEERHKKISNISATLKLIEMLYRKT
jgi:hypothetical protein